MALRVYSYGLEVDYTPASALSVSSFGLEVDYTPASQVAVFSFGLEVDYRLADAESGTPVGDTSTQVGLAGPTIQGERFRVRKGST